MDTKFSPEAHVKRSIVVRTVETRDGEVRHESGQSVKEYPSTVDLKTRNYLKIPSKHGVKL